MRVTDRLVFDRAARESGRAQSRAQEAIQRASDGRRVVHPGDDPAAAGLVVLNRARAARLDAVMTTAAQAADELNAADAALSEVANVIVRARELAMQLGSESWNAANRAGGAAEVRGLIATAVASLNAQFAGRYVFGGQADGAPPFDVSGAWSGDDAVREVEIAPGVLHPASVRAGVAVKGTAGGVDVLSTLRTLELALDADDPATVRSLLDPLSVATQQVSSARAEAGTGMAALDAAVAANRAARDGAEIAVAKLADVDTVEAATELALAERALEATYAAVAKGFGLTLLDKLR